MAKNPYEWLYDTQAQPLKGWVLDRVAEELAKAVEHFPPPIDSWEREDVRLRFEPMFAEVKGRPGLPAVRLALKLYRWELEREYEQIDQYMRGEQWREFDPSPLELETAHFLVQYFLDQTLAFKEYAQEKFSRAELLGLADRLDARLVAQTAELRTSRDPLH